MAQHGRDDVRQRPKIFLPRSALFPKIGLSLREVAIRNTFRIQCQSNEKRIPTESAFLGHLLAYAPHPFGLSRLVHRVGEMIIKRDFVFGHFELAGFDPEESFFLFQCLIRAKARLSHRGGVNKFPPFKKGQGVFADCMVVAPWDALRYTKKLEISAHVRAMVHSFKSQCLASHIR